MTSPTPEGDQATLPELAALETALGNFVAVARRRADVARQFKESARESAQRAKAQGVGYSHEEEERLLAGRLHPVAEDLLEVAVDTGPATAQLDAAMLSLVLRMAAGGLTPEQQTEAGEALDGMLTLIGGLLARGGLADRGAHFEDDGYRDRGLQASFDRLGTAFSRLDEQDEALIRLQELVYSVPGRQPLPGVSAPARPVRLEERVAFDMAVTRWVGSLRGWSLASEEFYQASLVTEAEVATAAGPPDTAARKRIAAAVGPAANRLQELATEYAGRMTDLDTALQSLLVRLESGDVSPADSAEAGRTVEGLRSFAVGVLESGGSTSDNDWLHLADATGGELGHDFAIAAGAFRLFQDQQPIIEGWARLPIGTDRPAES
jgi:hypothetical protein